MFTSDDRWNTANRVNRTDKTALNRPITRQDGDQPQKNFKKILEDEPQEEIDGDVKSNSKVAFSPASLFSLNQSAKASSKDESLLGSYTFPQEEQALIALANVAKNAGSIPPNGGHEITTVMVNLPFNQESEPSAAQGTNVSLFDLSAIGKEKMIAESMQIPTPKSAKQVHIVGNAAASTMVEPLSAAFNTNPIANKIIPQKFNDEADMDVNLNAGMQSSIASMQPQTALNVKNIESMAPEANEPRTRIEELKVIVDQIVKSINTQTTTGKTETIVNFKNSPLLDGATLRLTTHDTAPGQYNVTFANLRPDVASLIQQKQMDGSLENTLAQKGYTVHIFVVTIQKDETIIAPEPTRYGSQDQESKEGQKRQKDNEDEA